VDSGTYDYFSFPDWRNYFRSTRAHNTIEIDGFDQSEMQGAFMWNHHAQCTLLDWSDSPQETRVSASHNGYHRLTDPVTHIRSLILDKKAQRLVIQDQLTGKDSHRYAAHFHCHPSIKATQISDRLVELVAESVRIEFTSEEPITVIQGSNEDTHPDLGWFSPGYHQKVPITVLKVEGKIKGNANVTFELNWG
jgi:uncharacterized heparinase superfamily protein